jgi:hypothetical protein
MSGKNDGKTDRGKTVSSDSADSAGAYGYDGK